ncbi:MAG: DUF2442 domain-containing protein [candidate division KSB1 bacterium]
MPIAVQNVLRTYDALPELEKRELAFEILRRSQKFDFPPLSDEELVLQAEELFLELDRRELIGGGQGVHWPDIDEDISTKGMLNEIPARRPQQVFV